MKKVNFYDEVDDSLLKFAVIIARTEGNWVFCKHKDRDTWEVPGGHREPEENILDTAKRELYEETGAIDFDLSPVCVYSVTAPDNFDGNESFGMLYYAEIHAFEKELHSEIEKISISDQLPLFWTYPEIQPKLIREARRRGFLKDDYDAVVFDMDGVIFDSERAVMNCWIKLADKYGIEDIEKSCLACAGSTMERTREIMLEAYGPDFPYDEFAKEASVMYHEKYDGGRLPMKTGVVELLAFLKHRGKKIALASSTRRQTVINQLRDADILDYFHVVICGDMVERSKPAPDIFLKACEELGVKPENAYAIEDSYNGIRAAYAGNLRPLMVPDLLPENDEMTELSDAILKNLTEVVEYLSQKENYL